MKKTSSPAYHLSLIAVASTVLSLFVSYVLDGGDGNVIVMLLFFILLPISILIGIISSFFAIREGIKNAFMPFIFLILLSLYIIGKLS